MADNIVLEKSLLFSLKIISFGYEFQRSNKEYILSKQVLKESKETLYWLKLMSLSDFKLEEKQIDLLIKDCIELHHILTAILIKSKSQR